MPKTAAAIMGPKRPTGRPRLPNAKVVKLTVFVDRELASRMDEAVRQQRASSRSELIRSLVDNGLSRDAPASTRNENQPELPLGGTHEAPTT